jgi:hypothetical protein
MRADGDQQLNDNHTDFPWITRIAPCGKPISTSVVGVAPTAWARARRDDLRSLAPKPFCLHATASRQMARQFSAVQLPLLLFNSY